MGGTAFVEPASVGFIVSVPSLGLLRFRRPLESLSFFSITTLPIRANSVVTSRIRDIPQPPSAGTKFDKKLTTCCMSLRSARARGSVGACRILVKIVATAETG